MLHIILEQTAHTGRCDTHQLEELLPEAHFFSPEDRCTTADEQLALKETFKVLAGSDGLSSIQAANNASPATNSSTVYVLRSYEIYARLRQHGKRPPTLVIAEQADSATARRAEGLINRAHTTLDQGALHLLNAQYEQMRSAIQESISAQAEEMKMREDLIINTAREMIRIHAPKQRTRNWLLSLGFNHHRMRETLSGLVRTEPGVSYELKTPFHFMTSLYHLATDAYHQNPAYTLPIHLAQDICLEAAATVHFVSTTEDRGERKFALMHTLVSMPRTQKEELIRTLRAGLQQPERLQAHLRAAFAEHGLLMTDPTRYKNIFREHYREIRLNTL